MEQALPVLETTFRRMSPQDWIDLYESAFRS
jgi:hypothetical protein